MTFIIQEPNVPGLQDISRVDAMKFLKGHGVSTLKAINLIDGLPVGFGLYFYETGVGRWHIERIAE